jgi:asparagine synthase (glutamine-hydrolysing)
MCGIAAIVGDSKHTNSLESQAKIISSRLAHRGPDDSGIEIRRSLNDQTVALIHRRLAIIDLSSRAHQPMVTPDKRFWIIFNGEIYNFRELRSELEKNNTILYSNSDTEVILHLFAREGPDCLQKLRGMFAFCIWDEQKGELFFARDRFGIKPLYYAKEAGRLFVSSELKGLTNSGVLSEEFNDQSASTFLRRGCIAAPQTVYRNIHALEPGCFAKFNGKEVKVQSYWELSDAFQAASEKQNDISAAAIEIRDCLIESVRAHMVSDVPVAVFLSGGLDSTAIVSSIRQFYSGPLKTISIVFPGTGWDESVLARDAASHFSTDHVEVEISKEDFVKNLNDIFLAMDQPTVDGVNAYFVAKAAKEAGVKVALSGVGGDELLGGYQSFVDVPRLMRSLNVTHQLPGLQHAAAFAEHFPVTWGTKLAELLKDRSMNIASIWNNRRALFTQHQITRLIPEYKVKQIPELPETLIDPFWSISYLEMQHFLIPQLLRDSDVFTMHHGLELRTPFVDHLFLWSVLKTGTWDRNGATTHKIGLFNKMGKFLPSQHLRKGKRGFTLPFNKWLKEILQNDSQNDISKFFARPEHKAFVDRFLKNKLHWSRLWALYVLGRFRTERAWISQ